MLDHFKEYLQNDLHSYLKSEGLADEKFPECIDVEEKWPSIEEAYFPDGAKEFQDYPLVSLGWPVFIGMAMAKFWDYDWEKYGKESGAKIYTSLRDARGFDNMDDYILEDILGYDKEKAEAISEKAGRCAARVLSALNHAHFESGTKDALDAYRIALYQLYLVGMAMELRSLGYKYVPYNGNGETAN